jgi:hypothetical protein
MKLGSERKLAPVATRRRANTVGNGNSLSEYLKFSIERRRRFANWRSTFSTTTTIAPRISNRSFIKAAITFSQDIFTTTQREKSSVSPIVSTSGTPIVLESVSGEQQETERVQSSQKGKELKEDNAKREESPLFEPLCKLKDCEQTEFNPVQPEESQVELKTFEEPEQETVSFGVRYAFEESYNEETINNENGDNPMNVDKSSDSECENMKEKKIKKYL